MVIVFGMIQTVTSRLETFDKLGSVVNPIPLFMADDVRSENFTQAELFASAGVLISMAMLGYHAQTLVVDRIQ